MISDVVGLKMYAMLSSELIDEAASVSPETQVAIFDGEFVPISIPIVLLLFRNSPALRKKRIHEGTRRLFPYRKL